MGTEVLRPQNCLIDRIRISPATINHHNRRRNFTGNGNPKVSAPSAAAPARRKRSEPANGRRSASFDGHVAGKVPVAGKVTILRRGKSIGDLKKDSLSPSRADMYAGSAATMSPSPRALPLPSFFSKKAAEGISDDLATRDLRRLLRLE